MATKAEVLREVEESKVQHFNKGMVSSYIHKVETVGVRPSHLKMGDVFTYTLGNKSRPVVILSVTDCLVFGITLTSTENRMSLMPSKSRFLGEGWFCKNLVTVPLEVAYERFVGIYDNEKQVRKAKREIKKLIAEI